MSDEIKDTGRTARAWAASLTVFLCAVVFAMQNYKVAATMPLLMADLGLDEGGAGNLITALSLTGVILAVPFGAWVDKWGPRKCGLAAVIVCLIGNLIGNFSDNYILLLISRFIEGVGWGTVVVTGATINSMWFPPEKRGLPSGILSIWVGLGMSAIIGSSTFFFDPQVASSWRNVWWFTLVLNAVVLVLALLFLREPKQSYLENEEKTGARTSDIFKSAPVWTVALGFFVLSFGSCVLTAFASSYCVTELGTDAAMANELTSSRGMWMVVSGLVVGFLLFYIKKIKARVFFLVILIFVNAVVYGFMFEWQVSWAAIFMCISGLALGAPVAVVWAIAPEIAPNPSLTGAVSGMISVGQSLGGTLAGSVGGAIIAAIGYQAFTPIAIAIGVIVAIGVVVFYFLMKRKFTPEQWNSDDPYDLRANVAE